MAKRYDQKTKDEVVAFIENFNNENGRGGQAAAAKKYKLNPITIKSWLQKAGVKTPGKTGKKKKGGMKARANGAVKASRKSSGSGAGALERMIQIRNDISSLENEYESLKATL